MRLIFDYCLLSLFQHIDTSIFLRKHLVYLLQGLMLLLSDNAILNVITLSTANLL